jgi:hypothetical protein
VAIEFAKVMRGIMPTTEVMTIVEQEWALCVGGRADGHTWNRLEPKVTVIEALTLIARSNREVAPISASPDNETAAFLKRSTRVEHPPTTTG